MSVAGTICGDIAAAITAAGITVDGHAITAVAQSLPFPGSYGQDMTPQVIVSPSPAERQTWRLQTQEGTAFVNTNVEIELVGKLDGAVNTAVADYDNAMDAIAFAVLGMEDSYGAHLMVLESTVYLAADAARNLQVYHAGFTATLTGGAVSSL